VIGNKLVANDLLLALVEFEQIEEGK